MGAQLNIKSEDAHRLESRLAELTGESLSTVVTRALRADLEREERARDRETAADISRYLRNPLTGSNHDWLYDENGLPR